MLDFYLPFAWNGPCDDGTTDNGAELSLFI